jgi:hypothetical protein
MTKQNITVESMIKKWKACAFNWYNPTSGQNDKNPMQNYFHKLNKPLLYGSSTHNLADAEKLAKAVTLPTCIQ